MPCNNTVIEILIKAEIGMNLSYKTFERVQRDLFINRMPELNHLSQNVVEAVCNGCVYDVCIKDECLEAIEDSKKEGYRDIEINECVVLKAYNKEALCKWRKELIGICELVETNELEIRFSWRV